MDSKKNIVDLETFRDMLHISPRVPGQSFDELPFEEEILDFLRFRLSQAQILWGLYHKRNIDYAFLIWEDFVYQVEHKNQKKSNEMYYPRFTKVILHHFMTKKPSIPRRNKVNWYYLMDAILFSTIKVVSRHQNTQQYGTLLPIELMNDEIWNSKAYKEYYACATGKAAPKPKASARRKRSGSDTSITSPTTITTPTTTITAAPRLTAAAKGKQPAKAKSLTDPSEVARTEAEQLKIVLRRSIQESHISQLGGSSTDEGTGSKPRVPDVPFDDSKEEISWNSSDDEDVDAQDKDRNNDEGDKKDESNDGKEDDDDDDKDDAERDDDDDDDDEEETAKIDEPEDTESGGGDDEETESDEESDEEETREEEEESFDPIPRTPKNSEDDGNGKKDQGLRVSEKQRLIEEEKENELYRDIDINQGRGLQLSADFEDSHVTLTPVNLDGQQESSSVSSQFVSSMLNPTSDAGMESIFVTASSPMAPLQTTTPIMTPSTIATITTISHAMIPPTTIPSEVLQNLPVFDLVFRFEDRLKSLEVNFSEFIQTNQFVEAVSNIPENDEFLRTIDDNMKRIIKEHVKSQVKEQVSRILPRIEESVNGQLKAKVLTRSSHSSRTSYAVAVDLSEMELKKILIEKMEGNKEDVRMMMIRKDPSLDQTGCLRDEEKASASESAFVEEPVQTISQIEEPLHPMFEIGSTQTWISELAKQVDSRSYFNELLDTLIDFSNFIMNRLGVDTLTPKLLAGPTYELMRGSCNSLIELEYHLEEVYKATTDQLDWVNPEGQQYPHNLLQPLSLIPDNRGRRVILFAHFINNDLEYLRGGASSRKYTTSVTKTKAADYGHIKWIEDLVPRKLSNLAVEERFAFNVSLRMFTRSIVIQRHVEDLQLGVESYQKRLNLTKPDTYRSDLKRREAYTAYSNPIGFIYQNKDKKNRKGDKDRAAAMIQAIDKMLKTKKIMRSLESDGTLNDVCNALDDRLKGIRMQYLPQAIWRKGDKDRAAAMIQSIDKMLKTRRIMRSLERFVGGRLYEGDFRMLQRTI
uniref:Uncharacterized protein n=1 Tax=Tanacetum cinerariifolium TaxID=118510 RepID=A0A6L2M7G0_TANCI|nr:hypothetical protein [Tanacetum cinerariifolium]